MEGWPPLVSFPSLCGTWETRAGMLYLPAGMLGATPKATREPPPPPPSHMPVILALGILCRCFVRCFGAFSRDSFTVVIDQYTGMLMYFRQQEH